MFVYVRAEANGFCRRLQRRITRNWPRSSLRSCRSPPRRSFQPVLGYLSQLLQGVRSGERVENADLIKVQSFKIKTKFPQRFLQISKLFTDQLTLDNLPRPQLVRLTRTTAS